MAMEKQGLGDQDGGAPFDWKSVLVKAPVKPQIVELSPAQGSPVVKRQIALGSDVYLSISVLSFYHPEARKGLTRQVPLIFADAKWRRPTDRDLPQVKVMGPNPEAHPNMAKHGNYAFGGRTFFGPERFDGSVDLNIGLHLFKSNSAGRKLLDVARAGTKALTKGEMLVLGPAVDGAFAALKELLPDKETPWVVGIIRSLATAGSAGFTTGTWAALAGSGSDTEEMYLDSHDNLLRDAKNKPIQRPYLVYSIDATETNPDRLRVGGIPAARERLIEANKAEQDVSDEKLTRLFRRFCDEVELSDELTLRDRDEIIADAEKRFERLMKRRATFSYDNDAALFPSREVSPKAVSAFRSMMDEAQVAVEAEQAIDSSLEALKAPEPDTLDEGMAALVGELHTAVGDFAALVRSNPNRYAGQVTDVARKLRKRREFKALLELATKVREGGVEHGWLSYFGAAADIELHGTPGLEQLANASEETPLPLMVGEAFLAKAIVLSGKDYEDDPGLLSDCLGLQGRIWKQRAVQSEKNDDATRTAYGRAFGYYTQGIAATMQSKKPDAEFHQVNLLALIHSAHKRGIALGKKGEAAKWARTILKEAKKKTDASDWELANAGDAALYLGREEDAVAFYTEYISAAKDNPFAVNATRRQLVEVWGVDPRGNTDLSQIAVRMAHLSLRSMATVSLTCEEVEALASLSDQQIEILEATFDGPPAVPAAHVRRVLKLSQSVGVVRRPNGDAVGTGFLLHGRNVHPDLANEYVFMTNDHVVCDAKDYKINVSSQEARIFFEDYLPDRPFQVREVFWRSGISDHDCAILRLFDPPAEVPMEIEIAKGLPPRWKTEFGRNDPNDERVAPRVFVIGYPDGRGLEIAFEKNYMIDHELKDAGAAPTHIPVKLHYRAPTEGGNSGSPVLSAKTQMLIGLHHARAKKPLGDVPLGANDVYEANEGLWIQAILAAVRAEKGETPATPTPAPAPVAAAAPLPATAPVPSTNGAARLEIVPEGNAAFIENLDGRLDTAETGFENMGLHALESGTSAVAAFAALKPKPQGRWATLGDHPDTKHLSALPINLNNGMSFGLSADVLKKAIETASTPVGDRWSKRVLFGIRGALPKALPPEGAAPDFVARMAMAETEPDYYKYQCTMGVWDRDTDQVWVCPGSTVPAMGYLWHATHDRSEAQMGRGANLLSPGVYSFTVGTHANGGNTRQPGSFRQASKYCVMRLASPEICFRQGNVSWDTQSDSGRISIWDNIHAGLGASQAWGAEHYSAGCQVVKGSVMAPGTRDTPVSYWASFRIAAGLAPKPDISPASDGNNPNVVKTSEDGTAFTYVLLTAREVRLAAENMDTPPRDPKFLKLRRGSQGDDVKAMQTALGINADGDFGFLTQRALIEKQLEMTGEADGVVTAANAAAFGLA